MPSELHTAPGPVLLLAAPGTGKTYQLALRTKHLVKGRSIPPEEITVITFTRAATREMRSRISNPEEEEKLYIPPELQPHTICTMHSLGYGIIHRKAKELGLTTPIKVVDAKWTSELLLEDAAQLIGLDRSRFKATAICRRDGECQPSNEDKCRICERYKVVMRACNAIDYNDQILLACELLEEDSAVLSNYRQRAQHLLVDEYQDINAAQFRLIRLLTEDNLKGLFVVGDDDQSIYSFRGGSPAFIRDFESDFGDTATVDSLRRSRRCHRNILEGALAVVRQYDTRRRDKGALEYEHPGDPKIKIHNAPSDKREAEIILSIIREALPSKTVMVLVPSRAHGRLVIERLWSARIDYYASKPLPGKGLLAFDTLTSWFRDENDSIALRECLQAIMNSGVFGVPGPGVTKTEKVDEREAALLEISNLWCPVIEEGISLWQSLCNSHEHSKLLNQLHTGLENLRSADTKDVPAFLAEATSLLRPWANTERLLEEISNWVRVGQSDDEPTPPPVRILTLQGAKGLEADVVCVIGLEEGTIPKQTSDPEALAEQARLMYVSMTRARSALHLFHVRKRSGAVSFQSPYAKGQKFLQRSQFLAAIPAEYCEQCYHPAKS